MLSGWQLYDSTCCIKEDMENRIRTDLMSIRELRDTQFKDTVSSFTQEITFQGSISLWQRCRNFLPCKKAVTPSDLEPIPLNNIKDTLISTIFMLETWNIFTFIYILWKYSLTMYLYYGTLSKYSTWAITDHRHMKVDI